MPLSTWIRTLRLHWLSSPGYWASVMARADQLETDFEGAAAEEADREAIQSASEAERALLGDVSAELKRRQGEEASSRL
jgi:hypothetical protein